MNKMMKKFLQAMLLALMPLCMQAQTTLTITNSDYTTYLKRRTSDASSSYYKFWIFQKNKGLNGKKKLILKNLPADVVAVIIDTVTKPEQAYLEEIEVDNCLNQILVNGTKINKVTIKNSTASHLGAFHYEGDNSFLTQNGITSDRKFKNFIVKRGKITALDPIYSMLDDATLSGVQLNGGKYDRKNLAGVDEGIINPTNLIREIDMSRIPTRTAVLHVRHNLLTKIENVNHPNIRSGELNNNLLWSLDMNTVEATPNAKNYRVGPQKPYADLTVVKGAAVDGSGDEVRLYLPEGQSALFDGGRLVKGSVKLLGEAVAEADQKIFGTTDEKYFKLASVVGGVNADLDLYAKHNGFTYQYDTRPNLTNPAEVDGYSQRYMTVEVKTYPYIMYINPLTKQEGNNINYYSGTLWLDYDAVVPAGTTVWIVTGIRSKSDITSGGTANAYDQLELKKIGDPGTLIPAGTAMFVRANDQAGLYAFQKVWTHEPKGWDGTGTGSTVADTLWYEKVYTDDQLTQLQTTRDKIAELGGNLLEGAGTETDFGGPRRALSLGFESGIGTGVIGFWPFTGTKAAPHRCFIRETTYKNATGSNSAKGATFFFNDPETTGITHVNNNVSTDDDAWYSLDGRRLSGKPSWKGVYIHKGRKEVIR